jgi:hypothetical protein
VGILTITFNISIISFDYNITPIVMASIIKTNNTNIKGNSKYSHKFLNNLLIG